jgi:hypothetical protein
VTKIITLWAVFAGFLLWVLTSGCAHFPVGSTLFPVVFPEVEIPEVEVPPSEESWCEEAKPIGPGSDVECIGILTPPHKLSLLMGESDILEQTKKALAAAYRGRQADREFAESILQAREEQLKLARERQPKLFGAGVGIGVGSTLAIILTAVLASPPSF